VGYSDGPQLLKMLRGRFQTSCNELVKFLDIDKV
jgi:hypothetical protein